MIPAMRQTLISEHFAKMKTENEALHPRSTSLQRSNSFSNYSSRSLNTRIFDYDSKNHRSLSQKTLDIIKALDINPLNADNSFDNDIINSISVREKYEDLLRNFNELPLPYKYKKLLTVLESVDFTINNTRMFNIKASFLNIQQAILLNQNLKIDLDYILKINYVCPQFYSIYWDDDKLFIDLPDQGIYPKSSLFNRISILKNELISRVKGFHSVHLLLLKITFNPEKNKTWHSSFDLHSVPDIHQVLIPERPETILNRVPVKKQSRTSRLALLCKIIIKIFNRMQTPSLFLKKLIKLIQKEKWQTEPPRNIEIDVTELQEIFEHWISIIETESGRVVRLNRQSGFCFQNAWNKIKRKYE